MRERMARLVAVVVTASLVTLSLAFAREQNPAAPSAAARGGLELVPLPQRPDPPVADTARGRELFAALGCTRCHAVDGVGNPRRPLDGIGDLRSAASLRAWTLAEGAVADSLAPAAVTAKRRYAEVPEADLDALLRWLAAVE